MSATPSAPTSQDHTALRPGRGRRPAAQVRQAALTAAATLLFEERLAGVTFEKVATRAGVSKATLYKWWPSRGALALEAYFVAVEHQLAFDDTGNLSADLRAQLHAFVRLLTDPNTGPVIAELIGAAQSDPDLAAAFAENYIRPRRRLALERLAAAGRRGQLRPDVDLETIVDQLWGACYHRLLLAVPELPLTESFADSLVDNLIAGVAATSVGPTPTR